jgi:hypothetical protein
MSLRHRSTTTRFRGCCGPSAATKQPSNSGLGRLAFITIAVFLTALSSSRLSSAQGKQPCSAAMPSNPQGQWWSYRIIDGRKCWYEGKPGVSKSLLQWPQEMPAQVAPATVARTAPEQPRDPLESRAWAPNAQAPMDAETFRERWRARRLIEDGVLAEEAAPITDRPVTLDDDSKPPLAKADRLPLPSWGSSQPKAVGSLAIAPNPNPGPK